MSSPGATSWVNHFKTGRDEGDIPDGQEIDASMADRIQSWLTALFQGEHLSVIIGSGLTHAVLGVCGEKAAGMGGLNLASIPKFGPSVLTHANKQAEKCGRGVSNLEDQIKSFNELITGFEVGGWEGHKELEACLNSNLLNFYSSLLQTEASLSAKLNDESGVRALNYL